MKQYIYGIDVGGTFIKIGLFTNENHEIIDKSEVPTPKGDHVKSIFNAILKEINHINNKYNLKMDDVFGIGLAVPCPTKNGYISTCANLDFCEFDLVSNFKKILPDHVIVKVGNDATLAALGENMSLENPYDSAVLFTLGTGVGGGIILDSHIIEGKSGLGGEVGHIKVFETEEQCGCGASGCLEQVCGTKAILEYAAKQSALLGSALKGEFTVKDVFDAAKAGDQAGLNTVNRVTEYLAIAAVNLAVSIEPEVFIIGGGISRAGDFLLDLVKKYFLKHSRFNTGDIPVLLAKTGNDAGMIGSYFYIMQDYK